MVMVVVCCGVHVPSQSPSDDGARTKFSVQKLPLRRRRAVCAAASHTTQSATGDSDGTDLLAWLLSEEQSGSSVDRAMSLGSLDLAGAFPSAPVPDYLTAVREVLVPVSCCNKLYTSKAPCLNGLQYEGQWGAGSRSRRLRIAALLRLGRPLARARPLKPHSLRRPSLMCRHKVGWASVLVSNVASALQALWRVSTTPWILAGRTRCSCRYRKKL